MVGTNFRWEQTSFFLRFMDKNQHRDLSWRLGGRRGEGVQLLKKADPLATFGAQMLRTSPQASGRHTDKGKDG